MRPRSRRFQHQGNSGRRDDGRCESGEFFPECEGFGKDLHVCSDYDETDESRREAREAHEIDRADAKRKGYD